MFMYTIAKKATLEATSCAIKIEKKEPITIAMEYNMSCNSNPDVALAICEFVKSVLEAILEKKLGMKCKIKAVDCKPEYQTFCKFQIIMK